MEEQAIEDAEEEVCGALARIITQKIDTIIEEGADMETIEKDAVVEKLQSGEADLDDVLLLLEESEPKETIKRHVTFQLLDENET